MTQVEIKSVTQDRGRIADDLLRALPAWFGIEGAILQYVADAEKMPLFAAQLEGRPIGFVSLKLHNESTAEIHAMAIHPDFHRQGIGLKLLTASAQHLKHLGFEFLSVKTLSPAHPNKEYEQTRRFYQAMGFRPVEEFKTLWGEANPCLLMIKAL